MLDQLPRVLHVIPGPAEGPSMIFAKREVSSLIQYGVKIRPFFLASRTNPLILIREAKRLRQELQDFQPDLVHAQFGTMTGFICLLTIRCPLVITYRGSDLNGWPGMPIRSHVAQLLSQITTLRATQIICVSKRLQGKLWWGKERASVIPAGIDTSVFYPRPQTEARALLGWSHHERIVLFNGSRARLGKRIDLAEKAIKIVQQEYCDAKLFVMDGKMPPENVPLFMNAADCLILTSDSEGSPNVIKEALACNLPVVSVDVGDVRERLTGVSNSHIVSRDPKDIAQTIKLILSLGERSNGSKYIDKISTSECTAQIIDVYQMALSSVCKSPRL